MPHKAGNTLTKILLRHPRPAWQGTDEVTREPVRASPSALIKHFWLQQNCKHKHTHINKTVPRRGGSKQPKGDA
jgi:hypothetical protein